jgi:hypothetical protein
MNAVQLLADLNRRGIRLESRGGQLRFFPKDAVGPHLLAMLHRHKVALMAVLDGEPVPCPRCGGIDMLDVAIHDGQSVRRECARCGRFVEFAVWYGRSVN